MKEYSNLEDFNNNCRNSAKSVINETPDLSKEERIKYARKKFDKEMLNRFYKAGKLSKEMLKMLGSETADIKFSVDSMIKNIIKHPDIKFDDYKKIPEIIKKPDKITFSKSKDNSIILFKKFKKDNTYYQVVIKTTEDKKENYLTSFRYLSEKEFNKY